MNNQRSMKWAPFNSVINNHDFLSDIIKEKNKISKPIFSDEQINNIENKIIDNYQKKNQIELIYYKNGRNEKIYGQITNLDSINKIIILNYNTKIYFSNIVDILRKFLE